MPIHVKGHGMWMLDCEYTEQAERDLMVSIIDRLISDNEKKLAQT
jgi:hypothetical protein